MSKRDKLKFAVKKSLIVGTATATLGAAGCFSNDDPDVITNPVPDRGVDRDAADVAEETDDGADAGDAADGESSSPSDADASGAENDGQSSDDGGTDGSS